MPQMKPTNAPEPAVLTSVPNPPPAKKAAKKASPLANLANKASAFKPDMSLLQPLDEKPDYLRVVLYGDYGVGKTSSAASLAERGRVVFVDPENSVRKSALRKISIPTDNIMLWPKWDYQGMEQLYVTMKAELGDNPGSVFAVVIDTVTSLAQFWLEDAVRMSMGKASMKKKHPDRTQWDVFQDDYGVLTEQIRTVITRKLFMLPCHVVVLAHNRRGENEDGLVRVGPSLSPAAQASLLTYSDWVLRMTSEEKDGKTIRTLRSAPQGQIEAKDRFHQLDPVINDRSMLDLVTEWEDS